jgi:hypothetical protein
MEPEYYFGYQQLGHDPNFEIALNMPLEQLKFYCVNNDLFRSICTNQEFWKQRLQNEHPEIIQYKPENMTYGQYYTALEEGKIKFIEVAYNNQLIGDVLVFPTDTRGNVMRRLVNIMFSMYPDFDPNTARLQLLYFKKTANPHLETSDVSQRTSIIRELERENPAIISNGKLYADILDIHQQGFRGPAVKYQRQI